MSPLLIGSILISLLHAVIPNHWLPILAIAKKENWKERETLWVTFLAASAHVVSTLCIGYILAWLGVQIGEQVALFSKFFAPLLLIGLGLYFIWQHYRHNHFHIHAQELEGVKPKSQLVWSLALMMFFSPCMEVEAYFIAAAKEGWAFVSLIALVYAVVTVSGMLIWMYIALRGLKKMDWHKIEHNAGLLTGGTLMLTGILLLVL